MPSKKQLPLIVVDDDEDIRAFIADAAAERGFETLAVNSAQRCLDSLKDADFAAVIMDIVMPDMDGIELIRAIGELRRDVPVIIMSGYSESYVQAAQAIGKAGGIKIAGTLMKPFSIDELEICLAAL